MRGVSLFTDVATESRERLRLACWRWRPRRDGFSLAEHRLKRQRRRVVGAIDLNHPGGSGEPPYLNGRVVRCSLTGNNIAFFAVEIDVETLAFDLRRDPQPDRGAHHQCNY